MTGTGARPFFPFLCLLAFLGVIALPAFATASEPAPSSPPPDRREVWVPAEQLKAILVKDPKAVLLSHEQYETLLRDAKADRRAPPQSPVSAVVTSATYTGQVAQSTLQLHGEFQVDVLSDGWTEIPFNYRKDALGAVKCDGETALCGPAIGLKGKRVEAAYLLIHGRGAHRIGADFSFHIDRCEGGKNEVAMVLPQAVAGVLNLELPPNVKVSCDKPFRQKNGIHSTSVSLAAAARDSVMTLSWRPNEAQQAGESVVAEEATLSYSIDAERVQTQCGIMLNASLGRLPSGVELAVPHGAKVLHVEGAEVLKWTLVRERVDVQFAPGERTSTFFNFTLETPSLRQTPKAEVALPVPKVLGVGRVSGKFAIIGNPGVSVRDIKTDALTTQTKEAMEFAGDKTPDLIAAFQFLAQPDSPRVTITKTAPRFDADLDTLAEFRQDGIFIERTVALRQREGEIFQAAIALPASEEVLSVWTGDGAEPDWRTEGGRVLIRWSDRLAAGAPRAFKLRSRTEPEKWTQLPAGGLPVTLEDAVIEGVDKVNGYVALASDASFRLVKIEAGALEPRDGRKTPVRGDFAWFRGRDFKLALTVSKRPGELRAAFTGYALPMEDVLDVRGQLDFEALYSGVKTVRIQVPPALAAQFHFEGPQIAERKLDGDTWSVSFQKEITGRYRLAVSVQAPVIRDAADESRFTVEVPRIVPRGVQRASGVWAIEANTETEISFAAAGMNELDSLLAPSMAEYRPRHRVIGVFQFMGDTHSLKLTAVRHASAPMLATVVDEMTVDTVVTSGGVERHQARMALRTAGEQFLRVSLPDRSKLLSLTVDGEPVKPVGESALLRVQLPAKGDAGAGVRVALLYETPKREWGGAGKHNIFAPKLSPEIPVLKSQWRVFVPDGYAYRNIESNLGKQTEVVTPLLVSRVGEWIDSLVGWLLRYSILLVAIVLVSGAILLRSCLPREWQIRVLEYLAVIAIIVILASFCIPAAMSVRAPRNWRPSDFSVDAGAAIPVPTVSTPPPCATPASPRIMAITADTSTRPAFVLPTQPIIARLSPAAGQVQPGASGSIQDRLSVSVPGSNASAYANAPAAAEPGIAGLLPMKLDLPLTGRPLVFQGFFAPVQVKFGYLDWRTQARREWMWLVIGAGAFLALGRARPWRRTLWAILMLSFYPLCVAPAVVGTCNALLVGWLVGLALERFAAWVVFRAPAVEGKAVEA